MKHSQIKNILEYLVEALVNKQFEAVYRNDRNKRISVSEIEEVFEEYPSEHTFPPAEAFNDFDDYGEIDDTENPIDFDLWFNNQKSDLTLSVTVYCENDYSIDNIHVL